jgi:hypothetical protein
LAEPIGWAAWIVATAILWISRFFASVPGGFHQFAPVGAAATILMYASLALAAVPCFPDGRALGRKLERKMYQHPLPAFATGAVTVAVLGFGILLVG